MKKSILLFHLLILLLPSKSICQNGQWVWMKGDSTFNSAGNYNLQNLGLFDSSYEPLATYLSSAWTDKKGHFWLFGGLYNDSYFGEENLNTLWQFNPDIDEWALMKTSPNAADPGVYGTQGVADSANIPGARTGAATWVDSAGNLWLFGGGVYYYGGDLMYNYNDLWKYDITTTEWTWVKGSNTQNQFGIYGTKGVADIANTPGARSEVATWVDGENNLWLFGGKTYLAGEKYFNDLWKYNIATNEWTWVNGTNGYIGSPNYIGSWSYGQKNIAATSNLPPSRYGMAFWSDEANNFYLFGGYAYYSVWIGDYFFNDMWKYNINDNQWTWINGDSLPNSPGVSGPFCEFSSNYHSASRYSIASWKDKHGKFWMLGGSVRWENSAYFYISSRDLWSFSPEIGQWMKAYKDSTPEDQGFYGQQGLTQINNDPRSRRGAVAWVDSTNNFWVFGGYWELDFMMNDLWKYVADSTCNIYTSNTNIINSTISFFPNPAQDFLDVFIPQITPNTSIEIKNLLGCTVFYKVARNNENTITLSTLSEGIYILTIKYDQFKFTSKFIKL